jgi:hypothetical protein
MSNPNDIAPGRSRSYNEIYGNFFIFGSGATFISLIWCVWYNRIRKAPWYAILPTNIFYIAIGDFVSDLTFIYQIPTSPTRIKDIRTSIFVFTFFAAIANVLVMALYLALIAYRNEDKHRPFLRWLAEHRMVFAALMFTSLTSARMLTLMYSGMFNLTMFSAPLPISSMEWLDLIGLITVLLEDVPQLIVAIWVSEETQTWDSVAFTAVAFSVVSILVTSGCRFISYLYLTDKSLNNDVVYGDHLKASRAFDRGSMKHMRYMYHDSHSEHKDVDVGSWGGNEGNSVTEMPNLVAALKRIEASNKSLKKKIKNTNGESINDTIGGGTTGSISLVKQRRPSTYEINRQTEKRIAELSNSIDGTGALSVYNLSSIVMLPLDFRNREERSNSGDLSPSGGIMSNGSSSVATVIANPLKTLRRMSSFSNSPRRNSGRSLGSGTGGGNGSGMSTDVTIADVYELTGTSPPSHASYLIDLVDQAEKEAAKTVLQRLSIQKSNRKKDKEGEELNDNGISFTILSSQCGDSGGEIGDINASPIDEKETEIGDTGGTSAPQTSSLQNSISSVSPPLYSNRLGNGLHVNMEPSTSLSLSPSTFSQHLQGTSGVYDPSNPFYVPTQLPPATYRGRAATSLANVDKAQAQDRATRVRMLGQ